MTPMAMESMTTRRAPGWVESWPSGMPHQEIYLALLDQQASVAMSKLAGLLEDKTTGDAAAATRGRSGEED